MEYFLNPITIEIIKGTKSNEIIIYLDNELANRANKLLVQKL
jgi:hypothetical protein